MPLGQPLQKAGKTVPPNQSNPILSYQVASQEVFYFSEEDDSLFDSDNNLTKNPKDEQNDDILFLNYFEEDDDLFEEPECQDLDQAIKEENMDLEFDCISPGIIEVKEEVEGVKQEPDNDKIEDYPQPYPQPFSSPIAKSASSQEITDVRDSDSDDDRQIEILSFEPVIRTVQAEIQLSPEKSKTKLTSPKKITLNKNKESDKKDTTARKEKETQENRMKKTSETDKSSNEIHVRKPESENKEINEKVLASMTKAYKNIWNQVDKRAESKDDDKSKSVSTSQTRKISNKDQIEKTSTSEENKETKKVSMSTDNNTEPLENMPEDITFNKGEVNKSASKDNKKVTASNMELDDSIPKFIVPNKNKVNIESEKVPLSKTEVDKNSSKDTSTDKSQVDQSSTSRQDDKQTKKASKSNSSNMSCKEKSILKYLVVMPKILSNPEPKHKEKLVEKLTDLNADKNKDSCNSKIKSNKVKSDGIKDISSKQITFKKEKIFVESEMKTVPHNKASEKAQRVESKDINTREIEKYWNLLLKSKVTEDKKFKGFSPDERENCFQYMEKFMKSIGRYFIPVICQSNSGSLYKCVDCSYTTKFPSSLAANRHIFCHRTNTDTLKCPTCDFTSFLDEVISHCSSKHSIKLSSSLFANKKEKNSKQITKQTQICDNKIVGVSDTPNNQHNYSVTGSTSTVTSSTIASENKKKINVRYVQCNVSDEQLILHMKKSCSFCMHVFKTCKDLALHVKDIHDRKGIQNPHHRINQYLSQLRTCSQCKFLANDRMALTCHSLVKHARLPLDMAVMYEKLGAISQNLKNRTCNICGYIARNQVAVVSHLEICNSKLQEKLKPLTDIETVFEIFDKSGDKILHPSHPINKNEVHTSPNVLANPKTTTNPATNDGVSKVVEQSPTNSKTLEQTISTGDKNVLKVLATFTMHELQSAQTANLEKKSPIASQKDTANIVKPSVGIYKDLFGNTSKPASSKVEKNTQAMEKSQNISTKGASNTIKPCVCGYCKDTFGSTNKPTIDRLQRTIKNSMAKESHSKTFQQNVTNTVSKPKIDTEKQKIAQNLKTETKIPSTSQKYTPNTLKTNLNISKSTREAVQNSNTFQNSALDSIKTNINICKDLLKHNTGKPLNLESSTAFQKSSANTVMSRTDTCNDLFKITSKPATSTTVEGTEAKLLLTRLNELAQSVSRAVDQSPNNKIQSLTQSIEKFLTCEIKDPGNVGSEENTALPKSKTEKLVDQLSKKCIQDLSDFGKKNTEVDNRKLTAEVDINVKYSSNRNQVNRSTGNNNATDAPTEKFSNISNEPITKSPRLRELLCEEKDRHKMSHQNVADAKDLNKKGIVGTSTTDSTGTLYNDCNQLPTLQRNLTNYSTENKNVTKTTKESNIITKSSENKSREKADEQLANENSIQKNSAHNLMSKSTQKATSQEPVDSTDDIIPKLNDGQKQMNHSTDKKNGTEAIIESIKSTQKASSQEPVDSTDDIIPKLNDGQKQMNPSTDKKNDTEPIIESIICDKAVRESLQSKEFCEKVLGNIAPNVSAKKRDKDISIVKDPVNKQKQIKNSPENKNKKQLVNESINKKDNDSVNENVNKMSSKKDLAFTLGQCDLPVTQELVYLTDDITTKLNEGEKQINNSTRNKNVTINLTTTLENCNLPATRQESVEARRSDDKKQITYSIENKNVSETLEKQNLIDQLVDESSRNAGNIEVYCDQMDVESVADSTASNEKNEFDENYHEELKLETLVEKTKIIQEKNKKRLFESQKIDGYNMRTSQSSAEGKETSEIIRIQIVDEGNNTERNLLNKNNENKSESPNEVKIISNKSAIFVCTACRHFGCSSYDTYLEHKKNCSNISRTCFVCQHCRFKTFSLIMLDVHQRNCKLRLRKAKEIFHSAIETSDSTDTEHKNHESSEIIKIQVIKSDHLSIANKSIQSVIKEADDKKSSNLPAIIESEGNKPTNPSVTAEINQDGDSNKFTEQAVIIETENKEQIYVCKICMGMHKRYKDFKLHQCQLKGALDLNLEKWRFDPIKSMFLCTLCNHYSSTKVVEILQHLYNKHTVAEGNENASSGKNLKKSEINLDKIVECPSPEKNDSASLPQHKLELRSSRIHVGNTISKDSDNVTGLLSQDKFELGSRRIQDGDNISKDFNNVTRLLSQDKLELGSPRIQVGNTMSKDYNNLTKLLSFDLSDISETVIKTELTYPVEESVDESNEDCILTAEDIKTEEDNNDSFFEDTGSKKTTEDKSPTPTEKEVLLTDGKTKNTDTKNHRGKVSRSSSFVVEEPEKSAQTSGQKLRRSKSLEPDPKKIDAAPLQAKFTTVTIDDCRPLSDCEIENSNDPLSLSDIDIEKIENILGVSRASKLLACTKCDYVTESSTEFRDHNLKHKKLEENLRKENNDKKTPKFQKSKRSSKSDSKELVCVMCDYIAKTKNTLKIHIEDAHINAVDKSVGNSKEIVESDKKSAKVQKISISSTSSYNSECDIKSDELVCVICDYTAKTKQNLKFHIQETHINGVIEIIYEDKAKENVQIDDKQLNKKPPPKIQKSSRRTENDNSESEIIKCNKLVCEMCDYVAKTKNSLKIHIEDTHINGGGESTDEDAPVLRNIKEYDPTCNMYSVEFRTCEFCKRVASNRAGLSHHLLKCTKKHLSKSKKADQPDKSTSPVDKYKDKRDNKGSKETLKKNINKEHYLNKSRTTDTSPVEKDRDKKVNEKGSKDIIDKGVIVQLKKVSLVSPKAAKPTKKSFFDSLSELLKSRTCKMCGWIAKTKGGLSYHITIIHGNGKYIKDVIGKEQCLNCPFQAPCRDSLSSHYRMVHASTYSCDKCDFKAKDKNVITIHEETTHVEEDSFDLDNLHNKKASLDSSTSKKANVDDDIITLDPIRDKGEDVIMLDPIDKTKDRNEKIRININQVKVYQNTNYGVQIKESNVKNVNLDKQAFNVPRSPLRCKICSFKALDQITLDDHIFGHENGLHPCNMCSFMTKEAWNLERHKSQMHSEAVEDKDKATNNQQEKQERNKRRISESSEESENDKSREREKKKAKYNCNTKSDGFEPKDNSNKNSRDSRHKENSKRHRSESKERNESDKKKSKGSSHKKSDDIRHKESSERHRSESDGSRENDKKKSKENSNTKSDGLKHKESSKRHRSESKERNESDKKKSKGSSHKKSDDIRHKESSERHRSESDGSRENDKKKSKDNSDRKSDSLKHKESTKDKNIKNKPTTRSNDFENKETMSEESDLDDLLKELSDNEVSIKKEPEDPSNDENVTVKKEPLDHEEPVKSDFDLEDLEKEIAIKQEPNLDDLDLENLLDHIEIDNSPKRANKNVKERESKRSKPLDVPNKTPEVQPKSKKRSKEDKSESDSSVAKNKIKKSSSKKKSTVKESDRTTVTFKCPYCAYTAKYRHALEKHFDMCHID